MQTFNKSERLCNKKIIEHLYKQGNSFIEYPFKVIWLNVLLPSSNTVQLLINVSTRKYKKAVDRNYIKRLIRESYRRNKNDFCSNISKNNIPLTFALTYISKSILSYQEIENKIILILQHLQKLNEKNS